MPGAAWCGQMDGALMLLQMVMLLLRRMHAIPSLLCLLLLLTYWQPVAIKIAMLVHSVLLVARTLRSAWVLMILAALLLLLLLTTLESPLKVLHVSLAIGGLQLAILVHLMSLLLL